MQIIPSRFLGSDEATFAADSTQNLGCATCTLCTFVGHRLYLLIFT